MVVVLFSKDKEALEDMKSGNIQFLGQAGVDVVTVSASGTPAYTEGVAIIPLTNRSGPGTSSGPSNVKPPRGTTHVSGQVFHFEEKA